MLEAPKECLGDVLFEVHARILCNHSRPEIFGKRLVSDTEHIQAYSGVQELHLQRLVCSHRRRCGYRKCSPGGLDSRGEHTLLLEILSNSTCTCYFKTIHCRASPL